MNRFKEIVLNIPLREGVPYSINIFSNNLLPGFSLLKIRGYNRKDANINFVSHIKDSISPVDMSVKSTGHSELFLRLVMPYEFDTSFFQNLACDLFEKEVFKKIQLTLINFSTKKAFDTEVSGRLDVALDATMNFTSKSYTSSSTAKTFNTDNRQVILCDSYDVLNAGIFVNNKFFNFNCFDSFEVQDIYI